MAAPVGEYPVVADAGLAGEPLGDADASVVVLQGHAHLGDGPVQVSNRESTQTCSFLL